MSDDRNKQALVSDGEVAKDLKVTKTYHDFFRNVQVRRHLARSLNQQTKQFCSMTHLFCFHQSLRKEHCFQFDKRYTFQHQWIYSRTCCQFQYVLFVHLNSRDNKKITRNIFWNTRKDSSKHLKNLVLSQEKPKPTSQNSNSYLGKAQVCKTKLCCRHLL